MLPDTSVSCAALQRFRMEMRWTHHIKIDLLSVSSTSVVLIAFYFPYFDSMVSITIFIEY